MGRPLNQYLILQTSAPHQCILTLRSSFSVNQVHINGKSFVDSGLKSHPTFLYSFFEFYRPRLMFKKFGPTAWINKANARRPTPNHLMRRSETVIRLMESMQICFLYS
ncbi:hypothetical protein AVEN_267718-1 [Araneus ventricosus]|uniref:Uncharacterized protein n=1 Tax=Araneus ventricosus TaxID=182803 RepID=A0A4Y2CVI6_ARAVE|nr:hypothetical protein AVEN_267718-1 [Araneus ventricosus]